MLTDAALTIPTNLCAHTVECLQDKFLEMELLGQRVFALTSRIPQLSSLRLYHLCSHQKKKKKKTGKVICYYLSALGFILPVFVEAVA